MRPRRVAQCSVRGNDVVQVSVKPSSFPDAAARFAFIMCCLALYSGAANGASEELLVHGAMDLTAMEHVLEGFAAANPEVRVRYKELNTRELYTDFLESVTSGRPTADVLLSSAMDMQTKLANDGYALPHRSPHKEHLPAWAVWRDEAFAFSFEPIVTVYNTARVPPDGIPSSRYRMVELLTRLPNQFLGRVGTFDPAASGLGYLALTQDTEQSPVMLELTRALGENGVRLFRNSRDMLDKVATGELLIAYNVNGSYALARARQDPRIAVVLPEDYTLAISRIALVPRTTENPALAFRFVDFLLSEKGQTILAGPAGVFAIRRGVSGESTMKGLSERASGALRPLRVGPGLLVYLDPIKREKFLRRWQGSLSTRPALP